MRIFLKILLQIILVFLIVILAEYALYLINLKKHPDLGNKSFLQPYNSFDKLFQEVLMNNFRPVENKNNIKNPILIFGCSYAYGDNLKENQTFSHKLAKYTNSAIYNFGIGGAGVQHMYYMLNNIQMKNKYFNVINEPKYVFFLYVPLHNSRLYQHIFIPLEPNEYLNYDIKSFKRVSYPKIFYNSFILKSLDVYIATQKGNNFQLNEEYLVEYFSKSKKEMEKNWKNTKYYILSYDYNESCKMIIQVAEKAGWSLIFLDDLVTGDINGIEYVISEKDRHPNEHFWEEMIPNLAKRLDL